MTKAKDPHAPHYGPFEDMDGRETISPPRKYTLHGRPSAKVRVGSAKRLIDELVRHGGSLHSSQCSMLWVSLWWCDYHKRTFVLKCYGEGGAVLYLDNIPTGVSV